MDVKVLTAELGGAVKQAQDMIAEARAGKAPMTAERKATLDQILAHTVELKAQIAEAEELESKLADVAKIVDWLDQPKYLAPRTERVGNGGSETHKALGAMGWETKGGMIYAPTSLGKLVEYCPEEVLSGEMPDGKGSESVKQFYTEQRAIFQPEYRGVYLKFMKMAIQYRDQSMAYTKLSGDEQKALSEGTDTAGGFLVPPDVQAEVLVRVPMKAVMRNICRVVPTSRDLVTFPMIKPNAGSTANGSIYTSGFVGDWASETPAFTDTDPGVNAFLVAVRKIRCATKVSNDLVADSVFPFLAFLSRDGATNMALVEDAGFIAGQTAYYINGAGTVTGATTQQPRGILAEFVTTGNVDIAGTTSHEISNTLADMGSSPKLLAVQANLPQQYQADARWLTHRLNELKVRQLLNAMGQFTFAPGYMTPPGAAGQQLDTLQGKGISRSDFIPTTAAASIPRVIYGDFSNYVIAHRAGISTTILRERFADTDQTGIILWERVGGATWNVDGFRFGYVS